MNIYKVNAFSFNEKGGNSAGVVIEGDNLSKDQMLKIAKEVGFSETAFISKSNVADYKVRFFTPTNEVDLCGHATIATFSLLNYKKLLKKSTLTQETKAGILEIKIFDNTIFMEQLNPIEYETIDSKIIAKSLGINHKDIISPVSIFSTGLKDIIIHVKSLEVINNLKANFNLITTISKEFKSTGYHIFTLETINNSTAYCRNFAPLYGIDEESATGTASGALSGYLITNKLVKVKNGKNNFVFEQGYTMNAPSEIKVIVSIENNFITKVIVGGKCTLL